MNFTPAPHTTQHWEITKPAANGKAPAATDARISAALMRAATLDSIRALMLIRAYRVRGHLLADLDPLGLTPPQPHPELAPKSYGFNDADWDRPIFIDNVLGLESATLREISEVLRETYCGKIGVEFLHMQDPAEKAWIQERVERSRNRTRWMRRPVRRSCWLERCMPRRRSSLSKRRSSAGCSGS